VKLNFGLKLQFKTKV